MIARGWAKFPRGSGIVRSILPIASADRSAPSENRRVRLSLMASEDGRSILLEMSAEEARGLAEQLTTNADFAS